MKVLLLLVSSALAAKFNISARDATINFLEDQQRLREALFTNYSSKVPAVYTKLHSPFLREGESLGEQFKVTIKLTYLKLIELDEPQEKVSYIMDYILEWKDYRLVWNPYDFEGIDHIYINIEDLWIPELVPVEIHSVQDYREDFQKYGWVNYNGTAGIYFSVLVSVICNLDVYMFPFDTQVCEISFLSHSFLSYEQRVESTIETLVTPLTSMGTGEWQVTNLTNRFTEVDPADQYTAEIHRFTVTMERNPGFYLTLIVIPSFILNVFSIFGILMKSQNSMDMLTVGLTNIMSLSFILGILSEMIPKTRNLPILAIYIVVNLAIIVASIGLAAVLPPLTSRTMSCSRKAPDADKRLRWPGWLSSNNISLVVMQSFNIVNLVYFLA